MSQLNNDAKQLTIFDAIEFDQKPSAEQSLPSIETEIEPSFRGEGSDYSCNYFKASPLYSTHPPDKETPRLDGYSPGHCWYYKLGGRVLETEEIPPTCFNDKFQPLDAKKCKSLSALREQLKIYQAELEKHVQRYNDLKERGDEACCEWDLRTGYDAKFNLSLKFNHISYVTSYQRFYQFTFLAIRERDEL